MKLQLLVPGLSAYYYDRPTAFPQMTTAIDWSNWGVTESYNMDDSNNYYDDSKQQNYDHYFDTFQASGLHLTCAIQYAVFVSDWFSMRKSKTNVRLGTLSNL